jgi:hypothetical protein
MSDNTYTMRRVGQHLEGLNGIRFQRAMKNEESGKYEVTLDVFSVEPVNLQNVLRSRKQARQDGDGTLSIDIESISFVPRASTRLPRLVYHLNVSSYHSGTCASIRLIVSGAPLTATRAFPEGRVDTVDMRLRAEENWKRRRM